MERRPSRRAAPSVLAAMLLAITACSAGAERSDEQTAKVDEAVIGSVCAHPGLSGPPLPAGGDAVAMAAADLDNDGRLDLAVATLSGAGVFLNQGSARFAPEVTYTFPGGATSVAAADLDPDGLVDVLVTSGNFLGILFNLGGGALLDPFFIELQSAATSVATGDFDGDGLADVAVANGGGVSVLINAGFGEFYPPVTYATGSGAQSITTGDFNGDGKLDLAVVNSGSNTVSILRNTGGGAFAAAASYATGVFPYSVAAADFNGDAKLDLTVANLDNSTISVLLNTGTGAFSAQTTYHVSTNGALNVFPVSVSVGDFTGDGKADIAVATQDTTGPGGVSVFANSGSGTFTLSPAYSPLTYADAVLAADFTGDGKPDLATANASTSGLGIAGVGVFVNQGTGFFGARSSEAFLAAGDLNGDGRLDFVARKPDGLGVDTILRLANGTYAAPVSHSTVNAVDLAAVGDANGDGRADIILTHFAAGLVGALLALPTGGYSAEVVSQAHYPTGFYMVQSLRTGDFNGDGKLDLVMANENTNVGNGSIGVLLGVGHGAFAAQTTYTVGDRPQTVALGDLNGDGRLDLIVATYYGQTLDVLMNQGSGTFGPRVSYSTGFRMTAAEVGDVNGDGKLDIVVSNAGTATSAGASLSVFVNQGAGTFGAGVNYATAGNLGSLALADFNGDGKVDAMIGPGFGATLSVLLNQGTGAFAAPLVFNAGVFQSAMIAGDFNGDGKVDVAMGGPGGTNVLYQQCLP